MASFAIYDSLQLGKGNAISAEQLAALHGYSDTRALRRAVSEEREKGALIASCDDGYFRPVTQQEFVECWRRFAARARSEFRTAKLFRDAIHESFEGQISLEDDFSKYMNDGEILQFMD